jgi:hypothetical protein
METPGGTVYTTTYEWHGPKNGVLQYPNHWPQDIFQKLPCKLVYVGEDPFGKLYMRTDAGFLTTTFYRLRVKYRHRISNIALRFAWIMIMLGLASTSSATRNTDQPIARWFWQRPKKDQPQ